MRQIKFRGNSIETGELIYGGLSIFNGEATIFDENCVVNSAYDVDIETISKFTGKTDKNGKDIYEGDKFKFKLIKKLHEHIELIGSFDWNDEELRYEIDIGDNDEYVCLSYVCNGGMYDFELLP